MPTRCRRVSHPGDRVAEALRALVADGEEDGDPDVREQQPTPTPEPGGSACYYWNGYGSSATTRLSDAPADEQSPRADRAEGQGVDDKPQRGCRPGPGGSAPCY